MGKGADFERLFCKQLSLWWTDGKRDDVFWRTAGSGARATTRSKTGKKTATQYGDICAIDPIGEPLIDLLTIELKKGYKQDNIQDILDRHASSKKPMWERFFEQAISSHGSAGSAFWTLVVGRHGRKPWIWMPYMLWEMIRKRQNLHPTRFCSCTVDVCGDRLQPVGVPLDWFFDEVKTSTIKEIIPLC